MKNSIKIRVGTIEEAVAIADRIPELAGSHRSAEYRKRMTGKKHLVLIAEIDGEPAGFKVGYDKFQNGTDFYTWMGGVVPKFRREGVADELAKQQEAWIINNGFQNVILKTRNRHKGMLIFALKRGFHITDLDKREPEEENRILLRKRLVKT